MCEKNFFAKSSTSIGMKGSKGKNPFIKNNITRDINASSGDIETFDTFMEGAITKKNTPF